MTNLPSYQDAYYEPKNRYFSSEDSSFVAGDSPATLDVIGTLKRPAIGGHIKCDGTGSILVTISEDGTNYGQTITIKSTEQFDLFGLSIRKIKITHSGTDSSYRVFCR